MLLYVIPFLLLLVVAIVLKQRDNKSDAIDEKGQPKNKSTQSKESKTKSSPVSKARKSRSDTSAEPKPAALKRKAVAPELLQKLQQLIHGGHYSTAEAHINQALNRDPDQHELYLILLKIHALQKDELAINQLINHIRSLNVPELLAEAEAKRSEHEQMQSISNDFLTESEVQPVVDKNDPFTHLQLQDSPTNLSTFSNDTPFRSEPAAGDSTLSPKPSLDQFASDFNFDSPALAAQSAATVQATTLAFDSLVSSNTSKDQLNEVSSVTNRNIKAHDDLDFNFAFDAAPQSPNVAQTVDVTDDQKQTEMMPKSEPDETYFRLDTEVAELHQHDSDTGPQALAFEDNRLNMTDHVQTTNAEHHNTAHDLGFDLNLTAETQRTTDTNTALEFDLSKLQLNDTSEHPSSANIDTSQPDQTLEFDLSTFSIDSAPANEPKPSATTSTEFLPKVESPLAPSHLAPSLTPDSQDPVADAVTHNITFDLSATPSTATDIALHFDLASPETIAQELIENPTAASLVSQQAVALAETSVADTQANASHLDAAVHNEVISDVTTPNNPLAQGDATDHTVLTDELLQQFPELRKLNATQLDLDLAELYAEYAAPQAAKTVLDEVASKSLSPDQKQHLAQLLEQMNPGNNAR